MKELSVAVVLLNYNSFAYLEEFLPKLVNYSTSAKIYIIDNSSTDDSKEFVYKYYPQIQWIQLAENYGFAGGYYYGLKEIQEDVFVLLNSDVEVTENWLEPILQRFQEDSSLGACQPKILSQKEKTYFEYAGASGGFIDELGYPFCRGRIFSTLERDQSQYDTAIECFWATGCALFLRKDAYFKAGELDYRFFAHQEEIDLCWRLQKSGYKIMVEPNSVVYHVGGGTLSYQNPKKTYYNFRNNLVMLYKNLSQEEFKTLFLKRASYDCIAALKELASFRIAHTEAILKAYIDFLKQKKKWKTAFTVHSNHKVSSIYRDSIVKTYYLKQKKLFSQIDLLKE